MKIVGKHYLKVTLKPVLDEVWNIMLEMLGGLMGMLEKISSIFIVISSLHIKFR